MMRYAALLTCAALLALPSAAFGQADDGAKAAIEAGSQAWEAGWNAGNAAAIAAVYAEDAMILPPGSQAIQGREAIQAYWQAALDEAEGVASTIETKEVHVLGDAAIEVGSYMDTNADGSHRDHGKYLAVWTKVDGKWMLARDIFNSSM